MEELESDRDTAIVIEVALNLLHRSDGQTANATQSLLQNTCDSRTPETRYTLANGLLG